MISILYTLIVAMMMLVWPLLLYSTYFAHYYLLQIYFFYIRKLHEYGKESNCFPILLTQVIIQDLRTGNIVIGKAIASHYGEQGYQNRSYLCVLSVIALLKVVIIIDLMRNTKSF